MFCVVWTELRENPTTSRPSDREENYETIGPTADSAYQQLEMSVSR